MAPLPRQLEEGVYITVLVWSTATICAHVLHVRRQAHAGLQCASCQLAKHLPSQAQCTLGIMSQVRVMPNCWYLLVRFFLRVDRMFVRLREARLFCDLRQVRNLCYSLLIWAA